MATASVPGNLDTRAQLVQLRFGIVTLGVALGIGALLSQTSWPVGWRALAFVPFFLAAYGLLAAFFKTCTLTAMSGCRLTPDGREHVADPEELRAQRRVGFGVLAGSTLLSAAVTVFLVFAS